MSADDLKKFTKLVEKAINGKKEEPTKVKVLKEGKSQDELYNRYDDMLDEVYSFESVGGIFSRMSPSRVLKQMDPTAYNVGFNDWLDSEEETEDDDLDEASNATISKNNTAKFKDEDWTNVVLHNTLVVKFNDDVIILNTGSFKTNVTKNRMNACSNEYHLGYNVVQMKGKWFVKYKGDTIPYEGDKLELSRKTPKKDIEEGRVLQVDSLKKAKEVAPGATKIIKVEGGYMAFDTEDDYKIWKNQK